MNAQAKKKRPRDVNLIAKSIVDEAIEEREELEEIEEPEPELEDTRNPAAVALGRLGGKKGGPARAAKLSLNRTSFTRNPKPKAITFGCHPGYHPIHPFFIRLNNNPTECRNKARPNDTPKDHSPVAHLPPKSTQFQTSFVLFPRKTNIIRFS
jgi:hypothetical protein